MFTHDVIKQRYSIEGYLPNYPPHLISDEEMFQAFIPLQYFKLDEDEDDVVFGLSEWADYENDPQPSYFKDNYPSLGPTLLSAYKELISNICYHIKMHLKDDTYAIPPWVYSYMLKAVIGPTSDKQDIHDLLVELVCDNIDDDYGELQGSKCLNTSIEYENSAKIVKETHRPPTMFGEPYIIKFLRLRSLIR